MDGADYDGRDMEEEIDTRLPVYLDGILSEFSRALPFLPSRMHIYIYIYIFVCVCVRIHVRTYVGR